jgi:hypothetical protein
MVGSMAEFPSEPVSATDFFERFLPTAVAEADTRGALQALDLPLGVRLDGRGGGEWLLEMRNGSLCVERGSRARAAFTVVQSVQDWRGALWEGRGGVIGQHAAGAFRPGGGAAARIGELLAGSAAALARVRELAALLRVSITGGEGGDWSLALMLGPGEIPAEATTQVSLRSEDADAMVRGELNPLEAFMGGRIQIFGDVTLLMQLQAIQMQAADAARAR